MMCNNSPNGGVVPLISSTSSTKMPNQTGSSASVPIKGKKIGTEISIYRYRVHEHAE